MDISLVNFAGLAAITNPNGPRSINEGTTPFWGVLTRHFEGRGRSISTYALKVGMEGL